MGNGFRGRLMRLYGAFLGLLLCGTLHAGPGPGVLTLIAQPTGRTVGVGDQFSTYAQATGALGFRWYKNDELYSEGPGGYAFLAFYSAVTNSGDYYAVFTNSTASVTSQVARLVVIPPGPPLFLQEPQSVRVRDDETAILTGQAFASGGTLSYRWLRFGTNYPPGFNSTLFLTAANPDRVGEFQMVATATPGGSSTSRVVTVSIRPGQPPVIGGQPASIRVPLGSRTNLDAVITEGDNPVTLTWYRGSNIVQLVQNQTLFLPQTNSYFLNGVSGDTAGDYLLVASNRFGAVTSSIAHVSFISPRSEILTNLVDAVVGFGQYHAADLTNSLAYFDNSFQTEIAHTLALRPSLSLPPFPQTAAWHLHLSPSNVFHAVAATGGSPVTGTWGHVPGTAGFAGFFLTNYPSTGAVTRLEVFRNGTYGASASARINGSDVSGSESGSVLVFGPPRPITAVFTAAIRVTNVFSLSWYKDGSPLSVNGFNGKYSSTAVRQAPFEAGITNYLYRFAVSNVAITDLGRYRFAIQDFGNGLPGDVQFGVEAELRFHGPAATNAPAVVAAREIRSTGSDSVAAAALSPDGSMMLASQATTFGSGGNTTVRVTSYDPTGRTNWQTGANGTTSVLPTGDGGAFIAGSEGSTERAWFLRRVAPSTNIVNGITNVVVTNVWAQRLYGPGPTDFQINPQSWRANVRGLVAVQDGLLVAGQFSGGHRFGAVVVTNGATPSFNIMGGGVVLTNSTGDLFSDVADLYVAKYGFDGRLLWARSYGNTNAEVLNAFVADASGNLVLGGAFKGVFRAGTVSASSQTATNSSTVNTATEGFVLKLDRDGNPLWMQSVGGRPRSANLLTTSRVAALATAPDGRIYYAANRNEETPTALRPGLITAPRHIGQLRATGEPAWSRDLRSGLATADSGSRIAADAEGNLLLAERMGGYTRPDQATGIAEADLRGFPGAAVESGTAVAKFSPDGELLWVRSLDTRVSYTDEGRTATPGWIGLDGNGGIVVAGQLPSRLGSGTASVRGSGQRFDSFELVRTNIDSNDNSDLFVARLAPNYVPLIPQISLQPLSGTPTLTDRVLLEGQATGVPTPTYQWTLNGSPIPGATSRFLTLERLSRTNRGLYRLVASNSLGVVTSDPAAIQPQLTPNMRGWRYVTSVTNYLGDPQSVGLDNAGRLYVQHGGTAQGLRQWLERWNPDGTVAWRLQQFPATPGQGLILHRKSPVVTPAGEVLVFGRSTSGSADFNTPNGGFVARLDPETGAPLWQRSFFWTNTNPVLPVTLAVHGNEVRALFSGQLGSFIHRTALDGTALDPIALTGLPAGVRFPEGQDWSSRTTLAADGSIGVWAAGTVAWNFGLTNLPVQNPPGYALARYAADGTPQWLRQFTQTGATTDVTSAEFDDAGNLVLGFDLPGNAPIEYTFGTNRFNGWGGLAKVGPDGSVLWAKAWGLHVRDARVSANGDITFTGPIRRDYQAAPNELRVRFGTNYVAAFARNDVIVARVDASGNERLIRQTGSENFSTYDNARAYALAVNGNGLVATAGFNLMPQTGGRLDFGDQTYQVPNLAPFNIGNLFGDLGVFYAGVLDPSNGPTEPPVIRFAPPTPGSTELRLEWPAGYVLQRLPNLGSNDWSTLQVASPYTVGLNEASAAFFRVVPAQ